ncbi:MAG: TRAP transporter small permease [Rubrivivax sp.]|nr:TRAP transporter small permease [Rubrivivax sp.]
MNHLIYRLSRTMAWFGALVLVLLAGMSVVSIAGRALSGLGLGPVPGDFELVEVGTAMAVFCFLPWAHLKRGHAAVDLFWRAYPAPLQRGLEALSDALMLVVWALLIWRMGVSTLDYRGNGETSFILGMPVWWGYAASMLPATVGCIAYLWRLLESLGLASPPPGFETAGAEH